MRTGPCKLTGLPSTGSSLHGLPRAELVICPAWMHHGQTYVQRKPNVSIQIFDHGPVALHALCSAQAIRETILADIRAAWVTLQQPVSADSQHVLRGRYPQRSTVVVRQPEDWFAQYLYPRPATET